MATGTQPLKILHLVTSLRPSSQTGWLLQLTELATDHNHIAYIASAEGGQTDDLLRAGGVHISCPFDTPDHPFKSFFEARRLAAHVRKNGIDLIHAHDSRTYGAALWAGRLCKKPVVLTIHDAAHKAAARKAAGIVVESPYMAKQLVVKNTHICPPSYDPRVLNAKDINAKAVDSLWSEWDVPAATTVILVTEPFTEDSGYHLFIEALGSMRKLPFKAIICADYEGKPLFTELWNRIDELGLGSALLFIDKPNNLADMKNILAASDVVVFPNRTPTAESQSVLNALAMGKAVIVSTPSNRAEIVTSGETGWLMNLGNDDTAHQKLALAMTDAITDITRLQKMGTTATRYCKEHHPNTTISADLFAFYATLRNAKS